MTYLAIAFMVAIDAIIFLVVRAYDRQGVILALPWNIRRARAPRWFRFNMLVGWLSFWLAIAFTLMVSVTLLIGGANA